MWRNWFLCLCVVSLVGCSHLVVKRDDYVPQVAAKVLTRFIIGIPTFGISEMYVSDAADEVEAQEQLEDFADNLKKGVEAGKLDPETAQRFYIDYYQAVWRVVAEKQARRSERVARIGAALQAFGAGYQGGSGYSYQPMAPYRPMPPGMTPDFFAITNSQGRTSTGTLMHAPGTGTTFYNLQDSQGRTQSGTIQEIGPR